MSAPPEKKFKVDEELTLPPFSWLITPEDIDEFSNQVVKDAAKNLDDIAALSDDKLTFKTVILPIMLSPNFKTNPLVCQSKFLQHCSTDPDIRAKAEEAGKKFSAFKAAARSRKDVFAKVETFSKSEEAKSLGEYETHYLGSILQDFRRGGLGLSEEQQTELQQLLEQDSTCCSSYGTNLSDDKTRLEFDGDALVGLPADFIKERTEAASGKVVLTLKYPDVIPVSSNCELSATREAVMVARETAYKNNLELVAQGITLRKQIAHILGYKSWAHYVTETRMAGSPEKVKSFLKGIQDLAQEGFTSDLEELRQAKKAHLLSRNEIKENEDVTIEAWDTGFYHNLILKRNYGVDAEALSKYFPLDHVVQTTMEIYQTLLGLVFTEIPKDKFESWHEEVRLFHVKDSTTHNQIGHFYLDLHPRTGKYGHAAIFHLLKRSGEQTPVDCMLCNLPAKSKDGKPALLRHGNVVTFFHEFGHIMHGLCTEGDGNSTKYAKCPRDFVEAPSQMLENWCWQPSVLEKLSKHHETGKSIPAENIKSLIAAKNVHESLFMMRQIYLATLDMTIHGEAPPTSADELQAVVDKLRPAISGVANPPKANMLRNFGHLMNQYSAAYYGYLWAEVISADMFATRFESDCMNVQAGMDYRKQVLAPGGTGKIMEHLNKFLGGRDFDQVPFLKSRGIIKQ